MKTYNQLVESLEDSASGAQQAFKNMADESLYNHVMSLNPEFVPIPYHDGRWGILIDGQIRIVIYLEDDDFEELDPEFFL